MPSKIGVFFMEIKSDYAYKKIREMIMTNQLSKDSQISLQGVANQLNISKSPVREAFQRLQNDGLVKIYPNQGIFIQDLSQNEAVEIYELRIALESYVLEKIFSLIENKDIINLHNILDKQKEALDKNDPYAFMEYDAEQHIYFFEIYSNQVFLKTMRSLRTRIFRAGVQALMHGAMHPTYEDHVSIVKSLEKGDFEETMKNLKKHLKRGLNVTLLGKI